MKNRYYELPIKVKCHFCGTENPPQHSGSKVLFWAERNGWDWFTGNLGFTARVCPRCLKTKACEELRKASNKLA